MTPVPPTLDRVEIMVAAMSALLADGASAVGDPDEVGIGRIWCTAMGRIAGVAVMKEVFRRMGCRVRVLITDGDMVQDRALVAEIGGPVAAMRGAAPTALRFLTRLSVVVSGLAPEDRADPLEVWAADVGRLSPLSPVGDAGPSFELEVDR